MKGYKTTYVDIMLNGKFFKQIAYEYCPLWPIDNDDVIKTVKEKFPSLRTKQFTLAFSKQRIFK